MTPMQPSAALGDSPTRTIFEVRNHTYFSPFIQDSAKINAHEKEEPRTVESDLLTTATPRPQNSADEDEQSQESSSSDIIYISSEESSPENEGENESEDEESSSSEDEESTSDDSSDSEQSIDSKLHLRLESDRIVRKLLEISSIPKAERIAKEKAAREKRRLKLLYGDGPYPLLMATADRAYDSFEGLEKHGGVFPEGYQKWIDPNYPWICAVRSCRRIFHNRAAIGGHFNNGHHGQFLNDNEDGTLSIVKTQYMAGGQRSRRPAFVVSKKPLDPNEPPMVEPSISPCHRTQTSHVPLPVLPTGRMSSKWEEFAANGVEKESKPTGGPVDATASQKTMWDYISPFLVYHKSTPPKAGWVPELIGLPRVRDLDWNTQWTDVHPYSDKLDKDVTAMIVHLTGEPASSPCTRCQEGKGPFKGCVMLPKAAPDVVKSNVTGCANCLYHSRQTYCSHKPKAAAKIAATSTSGASGASETERSRISEVSVPPNLSSLRSSPDEVSFASTPADWAPTTQRKTPRPVYEPSQVHVMEMASAERSYKTLIDPNGKHISTSGTLIPEAYDLDYTIPNLPWICPVRDCRFVFRGRTELGCHFSRRHRGELFNDNEDGTLTIVAFYKTPLPDKGNRLCPYVIQKGELASNKPLAEPRVPGYVKQSDEPSLHKVYQIAAQPSDKPKIPRTVHNSAVLHSDSAQSRTGWSLDRVATPTTVDSHEPPRKRRRLSSSDAEPKYSQPARVEMEADVAWETAPGRLQAAGEDEPDNIAYSETYLSGNDAVHVHTGMSFRILKIKAGMSFKFDADPSITRLCSVAAGDKLSVKLDTQQNEFAITTHGMFKIKAASLCEIYNAGHKDAVLHVTCLTTDHY